MGCLIAVVNFWNEFLSLFLVEILNPEILVSSAKNPGTLKKVLKFLVLTMKRLALKNCLFLLTYFLIEKNSNCIFAGSKKESHSRLYACQNIKIGKDHFTWNINGTENAFTQKIH